jgi:hypothetical protein
MADLNTNWGKVSEFNLIADILVCLTYVME